MCTTGPTFAKDCGLFYFGFWYKNYNFKAGMWATSSSRIIGIKLNNVPTVTLRFPSENSFAYHHNRLNLYSALTEFGLPVD